MQRQMEQVTGQGDGEGPGRIAVVGTRQATILVQEVTLQVGGGTNSEQQPYRELTGVFQGKNGQVLLSLSAPTSHWDPAVVDAFQASIR